MRDKARLTAQLGLILVLALSLLAGPTPALACTSGAPSFVEAVSGAQGVARVRVIRAANQQGRGATYRVERLLRGSLPDTVALAQDHSSLCGRVASWEAGGVGSTAVIAFRVPYYRQLIHPVWLDTPEGLSGPAGVPEGVETLAELEQAIIRSALPDTGTSPLGSSSVTPGRVRHD